MRVIFGEWNVRILMWRLLLMKRFMWWGVVVICYWFIWLMFFKGDWIFNILIFDKKSDVNFGNKFSFYDLFIFVDNY